jgi:hypothetical protein
VNTLCPTSLCFVHFLSFKALIQHTPKEGLDILLMMVMLMRWIPEWHLLYTRTNPILCCLQLGISQLERKSVMTMVTDQRIFGGENWQINIRYWKYVIFFRTVEYFYLGFCLLKTKQTLYAFNRVLVCYAFNWIGVC